MDIAAIPIKNAIIDALLRPIPSLIIGKHNMPATHPIAKKDCIVARTYSFSQNSFMWITAVKLFVIKHWLIILHAYFYVFASPLHLKRGFINTNEPIIVLKAITSHIKLMNPISKYWYLGLTESLAKHFLNYSLWSKA